MEVRGGKMKVDALLVYELFQAGGALIIQNMEERAEAAVTEVGVEYLVDTAKFLWSAWLKGFDQYGISVMVKEDHEVFAAVAGSHGEATSLVCCFV